MDTTLVILLAVLACTFIGMIAAIIAACNRGPRAPAAPKATNLQTIAKPSRLPALLAPLRGTQPAVEDTIEYRGVVILTRHVDMRLPISR
jgi:hypothetical protein